MVNNSSAIEKWKEGKKDEDWNNVLFVEEVFKNSTKGERPTKEELTETFGNIDLKAIFQQIALKGELQLNSNDRKEMTENKRKAIINNINKNFMDPQTKKPYSVVQIDNALNSIKAKIDMQKSVEEQVKTIVKDLMLKLPLTKVVSVEGKLIIPLSLTGKVQSNLKNYCVIKNESWTDKSWIVNISLTHSEYDSLIQFLTKTTNGDFQFESDVSFQPTSPSPKTTKGKQTPKKNNKK